MVVTWVYIFVETHLTVLLNTLQFIVCKLYLNKVFIFKTPTFTSRLLFIYSVYSIIYTYVNVCVYV